MERFNHTDSVAYKKKEITITVVTLENELHLLLAVTKNLIRQIVKQQKISYVSVQSIRSNNNLHPYHDQIHQEVNDDDFQ